MPLFKDSAEERDFRTALRRFVARELTPHYEEWDKARNIPREAWKKMGKQGYICPWLPEGYGGVDADFKYSVIIVQELVRGDCLIGIPNHQDVAVPYIYYFGSDDMKEKLLPGCASGDLIACIAMTEPDCGSDLAAVRTKAVRDGDYYIINGQKTFITNAINADIIIVACKIEDPHASEGSPKKKPISLIVVEGDSLKYVRRRQLEKMGRHALDTGELFFEDCKVPVGNLLGKEGKGFSYMMHELNRERLLVCIMMQAYAEECLKEALNYAKVREAFGKPIGNFQHIAFELAQMATDVEIGNTFFYTCVEEFVQGEDILRKVSMLKAWLGEMVNRVAYKAVQVHGGYGYMAEYRVCRLYQDVRVMSIFAGSTEIMNLIVARQLGLNPIF